MKTLFVILTLTLNFIAFAGEGHVIRANSPEDFNEQFMERVTNFAAIEADKMEDKDVNEGIALLESVKEHALGYERLLENMENAVEQQENRHKYVLDKPKKFLKNNDTRTIVRAYEDLRAILTDWEKALGEIHGLSEAMNPTEAQDESYASSYGENDKSVNYSEDVAFIIRKITEYDPDFVNHTIHDILVSSQQGAVKVLEDANEVFSRKRRKFNSSYEDAREDIREYYSDKDNVRRSSSR